MLASNLCPFKRFEGAAAAASADCRQPNLADEECTLDAQTSGCHGTRPKGSSLHVLLLTGISFFLGLMVAFLMMRNASGGMPLMVNLMGSCSAWASREELVPGGMVFAASKAEEVMGELTADEVRMVASWFVKRTGAASSRNSSGDCVWLAGPSAVELIRPPKAAVLAYLDGAGPTPARFARVTTAGPHGVSEFSVGPLENGEPAGGATITKLRGADDVPSVKRPTEVSGELDLVAEVINKTIDELGEVLVRAFGPIFPQVAGFTGKDGVVSPFPRNQVFSAPHQRLQAFKFLWVPPAPQHSEAFWLHPVAFDLTVNVTSRKPEDWSICQLSFCNQKFPSASHLLTALQEGNLKFCSISKKTGAWDFPQRETPASAHGRQPVEAHGGVSWGPWDFTVTQRPSTGVALLDVRFRGERVLYELSLQDAQAAYGGTAHSQFFYSDAAWSLSMLSASLEPGVDCPEGAHFLRAADWYAKTDGGQAEADPANASSILPICIFEWMEDHTIWRHMENTAQAKVRGLVRNTIVVRSIATVGNYDYLMDVKFREDGEIEVSTRFAGYIESRYFNSQTNPWEANYSTLVKTDLAGPVHSHQVAWKADIDVAGSLDNSLLITKVKTQTAADSNGWLTSKYLEKTYVPNEGAHRSTFVADPHVPGNWAIVDRNKKSSAGNARGYAVTLGTFSSTQVLPDDHPFVEALPFTKYHLAVTKYHDEEYRVSSPYVQYAGNDTERHAQNLDRFLSDEESLLDTDLVAWICVGREHIVRQEDLPLVSNFGASFSLVPWNFFERNVAASPLP